MKKIYVVYWSGTGNTEAMAQMVGEGIKEAGKQAEVVSVSNIKPETLKEEPVFALGCPSMGDEVLEETEMEDFVTELTNFISGKTIGLFGSYGWGDGKWMRDWEDRLQKAGAILALGKGIIALETPDQEAETECKNLGKSLSHV